MTEKKVWFITGAGTRHGRRHRESSARRRQPGRRQRPQHRRRGRCRWPGRGPARRRARHHDPRVSGGAAVQAAVDRFGRIDVLVNNAGNFYAGFLEELTPEQIQRQLTTNLVGPMNVTRAVLPVMRKQRSGNVVTITSTAGIVGQEFCSAYATSKFGLEGSMKSLCGR